MRRLIFVLAGVLLLGLAAALLGRFYEPAQLAMMWVIWIGAAALVFVAGLLGFYR